MCGPHRQATRNHAKESSHATLNQTNLRYIINVHTQDKREYYNQMDSDTKTTHSKMIKTIYKSENQHVQPSDIQW